MIIESRALIKIYKLGQVADALKLDNYSFGDGALSGITPFDGSSARKQKIADFLFHSPYVANKLTISVNSADRLDLLVWLNLPIYAQTNLRNLYLPKL